MSHAVFPLPKNTLENAASMSENAAGGEFFSCFSGVPVVKYNSVM